MVKVGRIILNRCLYHRQARAAKAREGAAGRLCRGQQSLALGCDKPAATISAPVLPCHTGLPYPMPAMASKKMQNKLNDLSGSQWLYFTNTLWETNVAPDATHRLRKAHGAMKPPQAMAELVRFFTHRNERVLDPFAGVGGILLGAELEDRRAVGVEVEKKWVAVFEEIRKEFGIRHGQFAPRNGSGGRVRSIKARLVCDSCLDFLARQRAESFDAIITDPPYGVAHKATGFAKETNFSMYSGDRRDFANAESFEAYLALIGEFGALAYKVLRPQRYLVVLVGDRYFKGEFLPLGNRVAEALRPQGFELKGVKIWWNKATLRPFRPYAVGNCFVPNITHQNVLILRKKGV